MYYIYKYIYIWCGCHDRVERSDRAPAFVVRVCI